MFFACDSKGAVNLLTFYSILFRHFYYQLAVSSIKKQHLVEIKTMGNPPAAVKMAIESICVLLGEGELDWKLLRGVLMRENFISTIINFKTDDIRYVAIFSSCLYFVHFMFALL